MEKELEFLNNAERYYNLYKRGFITRFEFAGAVMKAGGDVIFDGTEHQKMIMDIVNAAARVAAAR